MAKPEAAQPDRNDRSPTSANPKTAAGDESNRIKAPEDWVTGAEPMTGAQASYLKTLSEEAGDPAAFDPAIDKAEASQRIDALRQATGKDEK